MLEQPEPSDAARRAVILVSPNQGAARAAPCRLPRCSAADRPRSLPLPSPPAKQAATSRDQPRQSRAGNRARRTEPQRTRVQSQAAGRTASSAVKYEEVYLRAYDSVSEVRTSLGRYLDFYNGRRPHSSLDDTTPDQAYFTPLPLRLAA